MREIKFRVFDKCHKSMHIVGEDTHDSLTCYDGIVQYYNLQNGEGSGEHGDYILMQYTGLKDKNGREIYEGDILYWDDNISGVIKYKDGSFYFETVDEFYSSWLRVIKHDLETRMEVIGNIYEHAKLLGN